jgi:hypothetical protein
MAITKEQYLEALKIVKKYETKYQLPSIGNLMTYIGNIHNIRHSNLTPNKKYKVLGTRVEHAIKGISVRIHDDRCRNQWYNIKTIKENFKY